MVSKEHLTPRLITDLVSRCRFDSRPKRLPCKRRQSEAKCSVDGNAVGCICDRLAAIREVEFANVTMLLLQGGPPHFCCLAPRHLVTMHWNERFLSEQLQGHVMRCAKS